jgi:hypothetical protein
VYDLPADGCSLITKGDAETAAGQPVSDGILGPQLAAGAPSVACVFLTAVDQMPAVTVIVNRYPSADVPRMIMSSASAAPITPLTVADLGDQAFLIVESGGASVVVQKANLMYTLAVANTSGDAGQLTADLARLVVSRFP